MDGRKPPGWPDLDKPVGIFELGTYTAKFYEVEDPKHGNRIEVLLERRFQATDGTERTKSFATTMDQIEAVVRRADALEKQGGTYSKHPDKEKPDRAIQLGPDGLKEERSELMTANFYRWEDTRGRREILVKLDRAELDRDGVRTQDLWFDRERLGEVVTRGKELEKERGLEPQWYSALRVQGLTEWGEARVQVMKSAREVETQTFRNEGSVYDPRPTRRPREEGSLFLVNEQELARVGPEIRYLQEEQKRNGPQFLLGEWYEKGVTPHPGTEVKWDLGRDPTSREPVPYKVIPVGVEKPQGVDDQPIHVLIRKDTENFPPRHRVEHATHDPAKAEEMFRELQGLKPRQELTLEPHQKQLLDLSESHMPGGFRL